MAPRRRRDGNLVEATRARIAELVDPDIALVALAYRAAELLGDPDTASASMVKEYRATMTALAAGQEPRGASLDDLAELGL